MKFDVFWTQMIENPLLFIAVTLTLGVILVNGWTDAPNAIATCVVTRNSTDALATLSWCKIYDCFEACSDACEHVSECVGSIVMKNT